MTNLFAPIRDREEIKKEFEQARQKYQTITDEKDKRLFGYQVVRPLWNEYHIDVLDTFEVGTWENGGRGVRLYTFSNLYFVSTIEVRLYKGIRSSMSGQLFFGGTVDADAAQQKYDEQVRKIRNGNISQD